jgi:alkylation response protein AidB-like acyl-CoA dehydrogenase
MSSESVSAIIHKVCRDFRRNEIEPVALELDESHDAEKVKAIWRKGSELDLPSMLVPEELGGAGQSVLTAAQVLGEIAGACPGIATMSAFHLAACLPVIENGRAGYGIVAALAGEEGKEPAMLTLAFPEAVEAQDRPRLVEKSGGLSLEGLAPLVCCASLAGHLVLFAEDAGGVTAVMADLHAPGVSVGEKEELLGLHAVPFCDVAFESCELGEDGVVGERGSGAAMMERALAALRGFIAAIAMGAAGSAHAAAHSYALERFQFGKTLIEHHEIRRMLSGMVAKMEMGTAGYVQALSGDASDLDACGRACARAKVFCTDAALDIVLDSIQIHGGYGYMKETGLEKTMRDAKMLQLVGGSNRLLEVE